MNKIHCKISNKVQFYFLIFFILLLSNLAYSLPTYINPDTWKEKPPSLSKINIYDDILLGTVPRFWHNFSPSGHNLGTKIEVEVLIWEGEDFCAFISYDRIFDPDWAFRSSAYLGRKFINMWKQTNNSPSHPFYNEKCALYDTTADYSGSRKWQYNSYIGRIDKKKGIKGNLKPVRVQLFEYLNPKMECLFLAGGLGNSGYIGYSADLTLAGFMAHICVKDKAYFTTNKIKEIARSIGVEDIESVSLKIKAPPPKKLKLDLSKFNKVTGKKDNYSIKFSNINNQNKNLDTNNLAGLSIEERLRRLKYLFDEQLISQEDYDEKRQKILKEF